MFQGFSQETVDFMWGIRFNNNRGWFEDHKESYRRYFYEPMRELAAQVQNGLLDRFPKSGLNGKVSRIYRDARRLFGRGPYKDHLWFTLCRPAEHEGAVPCFFFEVAPDRYSYGMGCWDPTPLTMAKLRARMDRDPAQAAKLVRQVERRGEFQLEGEPYKRPKGDPGPLLYPWYNSRQFSLCRDENCEGDFFTPALKDRVLEGWKSLVPVYRWLLAVEADPPPEQM